MWSQQRRWMTSGEYIQMSGRAGRRGKDDFGVVIQMIDDKMDTDACRCADLLTRHLGALTTFACDISALKSHDDPVLVPT